MVIGEAGGLRLPAADKVIRDTGNGLMIAAAIVADSQTVFPFRDRIGKALIPTPLFRASPTSILYSR